MDTPDVLETICKEIGLNKKGTKQLISNVDKYIQAWDRLAVSGEHFHELDDAEVQAYSSRYLEKGWDRAEPLDQKRGNSIKVPPGKELWGGSTVRKRSTCEYPRDFTKCGSPSTDWKRSLNVGRINNGVKLVFDFLKESRTVSKNPLLLTG